MAKLKPKKKQEQIIFNSKQEFNQAVNAKFKPLIDEEVKKLMQKYEAAVSEAKTNATREALILILPIACNALYEAYGYREKRLEKFVRYFQIHMECLNDGVTDLDDYKQWCQDQGYKFIDVLEVQDWRLRG